MLIVYSKVQMICDVVHENIFLNSVIGEFITEFTKSIIPFPMFYYFCSIKFKLQHKCLYPTFLPHDVIKSTKL